MDRKQFATVLMVAALAGLVGGALSGRFWATDPAWAQQRFKVVNAEEFLLVDKFGRTRAGLGLDANGEIGLVLTGREGNRRLYFSPDEKQALRLLDKDNRVLWAAP
ncbi:MAG: hypothetical protein AB1411_04135 [Nitrospirota bacterium]